MSIRYWSEEPSRLPSIPMGNDYQVNDGPRRNPPVGEVSNAQAVAGDQMITVSWSDPGRKT